MSVPANNLDLNGARSTVYTVSTTVESSGASKHKATVLIEPPMAARPANVSTTMSEQNLEEYAVQLPHMVSSPSKEVPLPVSKNSSENEKPMESPVVWGPGGCSQNPTKPPTVPVAFSFELAPNPSTCVTVSEPILPFSSAKVDKETDSTKNSFLELKSDVTSPLPSVVPISPSLATNSHDSSSTTDLQEGDTPKPIDDDICTNPHPGLPEGDTPKPSSDPIPIATSCLSYSQLSSGPDTRTVGTSPPELSYSRTTASPPGSGLSYSQATHGSDFNKATLSASLAQGTTGAPYSSTISGLPSYASPTTSPSNFASSAH